MMMDLPSDSCILLFEVLTLVLSDNVNACCEATYPARPRSGILLFTFTNINPISNLEEPIEKTTPLLNQRICTIGERP